MKREAEVFNDLASLCVSPGYIHALALICFQDNMLMYAGEVTHEDFGRMFRPDRIIRAELTTLCGLMLKTDIDFSVPQPETVKSYVDRTYKLLEELHKSMFDWFPETSKGGIERLSETLKQGSFLREPMFYSGESAYSFQFRDLAVPKYRADNYWLQENKGFTIEQARAVVQAVQSIINNNLSQAVGYAMEHPDSNWTLLPGFTFTPGEISASTSLSDECVTCVLNAFSSEAGATNLSFTSMHDFNIATAKPILRIKERSFILLEQYKLVQAIYESPFYWMGEDKSYVSRAMKHRGEFVETFSRERFKHIFGSKAVYSNLTAYKIRAEAITEIDTLVVFGNRAIVIQAKSKRLTIESRRGNDHHIRDDFQKSVQDAYNQGLQSARALQKSGLVFRDSAGKEVKLPSTLKRIYVMCLVADHYPALSFQAEQFLEFEKDQTLASPFVLDIFTLDTMTEFLTSPLQFLSYVERRTFYEENISALSELVVLSYHLQRNLWVEQGIDRIHLSEGISAPLDLAMTVRRDGVEGNRDIKGPISHLNSTTLGKIVKQIERSPIPGVIDLGFSLLSLSGTTISNLSDQIDLLSSITQADGGSHDISLPMRATSEGLTIHCNMLPNEIAVKRLDEHCRMRKYKGRASRWFGLCVRPGTLLIRFGVTIDSPWEYDPAMDAFTRENFRGGRTVLLGNPGASIIRIGRNDKCPCGSGRKYKRCCLDD